MAIDDVDVVGSDGWWMQKAWLELKAKRPRLTNLENYRRGTPPIQNGDAATRSAYYRFSQQCRTNVADLAVQALVERLSVRTIRTTASSDDDGDVHATRMLAGMGGDQDDFLRMVATFGKAYTSASAPVDDAGYSQLSAEDPREVVVLTDVLGRSVAAFKLFYEPLSGFDYAILWRPGRKVVAFAPNGTPPPRYAPDRALREPKIQFTPSRFTIRPEAPDDLTADQATNPATPLWSESYSVLDIPVQQHTAPEGVGVFERHLDLVDQINHIILRGLVISAMQAFRQRYIETTTPLPDKDADGNPIDYDNEFPAEPGAIWNLPAGAKVGEAGQVQMGDILQQAKDAIQRFASVTRTPFSMFMPDVAQSAEGAQNTREGIVFKAEAFQRVETLPICRMISVGFKFMPDDVRYVDSDDGAGRVDRADLTGMSIDWLPAERYSLQEKAAADAAAVSLPRRQKYRLIWQMTPAEIDLAMSQVQEDALLAPQPAASRSVESAAAAA